MRSLENILTDWREWPIETKPVLIKEYGAGLNHQTLLLESDKFRFVLKVFQSEARRQIQAQRWAAKLGLAPKVLYAAPNKEYMLMNLVDGSSLADAKLSIDDIIALGNGLGRMHRSPGGPVSDGGFDIRAFCDLYMDPQDTKAQALDKLVVPAMAYYQADTTPWVYCHNDLVAANCFIKEERAQFIDWEYADQHNPWFDIAAVVYYLRLNHFQVEQLLNAYSGAQKLGSYQEILLAAQIVLLWGDMLWHLKKFGQAYWQNLGHKERDLLELINQFQNRLTEKQEAFVQTVDDVDNSRYTVELEEGHLGFIRYKKEGSVISLLHAEVPFELRGKSYGAVLMEAVMKKVQSEGQTVIPVCGYTRAYLAKNTHWSELLES